MKPVEQTILAPPHGDCFRACIASLLELPIEEVPNFGQEEGEPAGEWFQKWQRWLAPRQLILYTWDIEKGGFTPPGYALLGADSPRGDWLHSVVCLDGQIVWDPHPGRADGVGKWRDWTVFGILDPARVTGKEATS